MTGVHVHSVFTNSIVLARTRLTVINVGLAIFTCESVDTETFIGIKPVATCGAIVART